MPVTKVRLEEIIAEVVVICIRRLDYMLIIVIWPSGHLTFILQ